MHVFTLYALYTLYDFTVIFLSQFGVRQSSAWQPSKMPVGPPADKKKTRVLNIQSGPSDVITTANTILDSATSRSLMIPVDGPAEETGVLGCEHGSFWDILRYYSGLGCNLDSTEEVAQRRMFARLISIWGNSFHPLHYIVKALGRSFSNRLTYSQCRKEPKHRFLTPHSHQTA